MDPFFCALTRPSSALLAAGANTGIRLTRGSRRRKLRPAGGPFQSICRRRAGQRAEAVQTENGGLVRDELHSQRSSLRARSGTQAANQSSNFIFRLRSRTALPPSRCEQFCTVFASEYGFHPLKRFRSCGARFADQAQSSEARRTGTAGRDRSPKTRRRDTDRCSALQTSKSNVV